MDEVKDPLVDDTLEGTKVVSSVSDLIINVPKANEGNNIDVNTETDNDDENIDSIDLDIEEPEEPVIEETKLELNPNLFDINGVMIADVRQHLLQIAKEFFSQTSIPYDDYKNQILDIRLVGSNAGYNYTYNSDIDLHIVVDLYAIADSCPELLADLFDLEKSKFNMSYDITISEIPVEIYVEDVKASTKSNGIYSILKNDWIKKPDVNEYKDDHVILTDDDEVAQIIDQINNLIDNNTSAKSIQDELNNLYMVRKTSLETEEPKGNQIFKTLRSVGLIDKLKQAYYDKKSKELSMESMHKKFVKFMDEDLTHDEDEDKILEIVEEEFGTTDIPYKGITFILPNGLFLDMQDSVHHSDVEKFLIDKGFSEGPYGETTGSPTLKALGCIRCDTVKYYIALSPVPPTDDQFTTLLNWLDYMGTNTNKKMVEVNAPNVDPVMFTLEDAMVSSDYVIDEIRHYYMFGTLNEEVAKHELYDRNKRNNLDEDFYDYLDDGDYNNGYITYDDYYDDYQDDLSEQEFKDALYFALDYFEDGIEYNDDDSLFSSDLQYQCYLDLINMDELDFYNEYNDELGEIKE